MAQERLDKLLASTGLFSRREVKDLVRQGRVLVDGCAAARPEEKYDPEKNRIFVDGEEVDCAPFVYIMMHKPDGLLSATRDNRQKTVLDLLDSHLRSRGLFPVGRLDKDTTGFLLLTDDGPLGHELLSPKKHVAKLYWARVDGVLDEEDVTALAEGMTLGDGLECLPARLEILEDGNEWCKVKKKKKTGYMMKKYLNTGAAQNIMYVRTNTGIGLNLRVGVLGSLRLGSLVKKRTQSLTEVYLCRGLSNTKEAETYNTKYSYQSSSHGLLDVLQLALHILDLLHPCTLMSIRRHV